MSRLGIDTLSSSFPFVRGEVLPATFSPPHLIVFSTLLMIRFLFVVVMYTHCIAFMAGIEYNGINYSDRMRCRAADGSNMFHI